MAKDFNLTSKTGRERLKPRREPYWHRIEKGLYLGYRKPEQGEGTWIARRQDAEGKKKYQALGTMADAKDAVDEKRAFDRAKAAALQWAGNIEIGIDDRGQTVADVCREYVADLKVRKGTAAAADAEGRFKRLVYGSSIGKTLIAKLSSGAVLKWRNALIPDGEIDTRQSKDSANRNLNALKAALNFGRDRLNLVASDVGWVGVAPFKDVGRRRTGFLTVEERGKLIAACPEDLANLVKALLLTAARPGELAGACVKDFDKEQGTIELTGKTGHRVATLSSAARTLFAQLSQDRIGNAPLLPRVDGGHWNKDGWKKPFKAAVAAAGLPASTVAYTLRHVAITELVNSGADSFIVAKLAGTSTAMIDKHYGHLRHDKTRARLDAVRMI